MSKLSSWTSGGFLLPYLTLVIIHVLSGLHMEQPTILADEMGYLGNARYLSGASHMPDMRNCNFYQFGYSLILLPAFWLFTEPVSIYKAAIMINAFLASALYFPLHFILISFLEVPKALARWIAFTCCLYPPVLLYSNFALAENAFIPAYALATALFGKYLVSRSSSDALLFGFSVSFLYTVHPRALPVLAIILVYILILAFLRIIPPWQSLLSASAMGAVFVLTRLINGHLKAIGWASSGEFSPTKLAGRLLPGNHFPALIERALGQALYLIQASHGLFLLGLIASIWLIFRKRTTESPRRIMADPRTGVPIFVLITAAGIFFASCTSTVYSIHGPKGVLGANLIHGRHNEAFAVLFLVFALAEYRTPSRQILWRAIAVVATISILTFLVMSDVDDARIRHVAGIPGVQSGEAMQPGEAIPPADVDAINVPGVFPLVGIAGALDLYPMSLAVMISFLIILLIMRFSRRGGMALLMLFFSCFAIYNHFYYLSPAREAARPRLHFVTQASRLGPISSISYDMAYRDPPLLFGIQFLMPHTSFNRFDSRAGEEPASEAVLTSTNWAEANHLGAKFVVASGSENNALWLLPGEMQSRMPTPSHQGVNFGSRPAFAIRESGFHGQDSLGQAPARWTNGAATLSVPLDPSDLPQTLEIEIASPGRNEAKLQVLANGVELWNEQIPNSWSNTLRLRQVPMADAVGHVLAIHLNSDTLSPKEHLRSSMDDRRLGVMVRGLRLKGRDPDPAAAYENVTLGARHIFGLPDSGFHQPQPFGDATGRWTSGTATLRVPLDPKHPPWILGIETIAPGRGAVPLQVLANGIELWNQPVAPDSWSRTFSLEQVPLNDELVIKMISDTFTPGESAEGEQDQRNLGIVVRGIQLASRDRLAIAVAGGMTLAAEPIFGIQESGFYRTELFDGQPARWTNGAATLRVPLSPGKSPRVLEIEAVTPSRDGARLQIFANGMELWNQRIPPQDWSKTISLEQVPMDDELLIEVKSDTFSPAESIKGSGDQRSLGIMVLGLRLQSEG